MPALVKMSLAQAQARPLRPAERARLAALATKSDAEIDFSDQPEITTAAIASGRVRVIGRGGTRAGAGRKPLGKLRKTVKLSPKAITRLRAYARRRKLASFSDAIEAASLTLR